MRCVNAFFIDITNIFVNMTDFSCHFNQKDALRIPNECLCVILTYYFLLCSPLTCSAGESSKSLEGGRGRNRVRRCCLLMSFQECPHQKFFFQEKFYFCFKIVQAKWQTGL